MPRVLWTPVAESDLDDILFYVALVAGKPTTAHRLLKQIRGRLQDLANQRIPGHVHPNAPEGWFYLRHKRWLLFYRPLSGGIEVMRVIDATRDLPQHLRDA
jgi:plasmid stabilization system protein ParE